MRPCQMTAGSRSSDRRAICRADHRSQRSLPHPHGAQDEDGQDGAEDAAPAAAEGAPVDVAAVLKEREENFEGIGDAFKAIRGELEKGAPDFAAVAANATDAAEADEAVYSIESGEVLMTGNVLLSQGQTIISGEKLTVDITNGTGRMEGRVTTTFTPPENN